MLCWNVVAEMPWLWLECWLEHCGWSLATGVLCWSVVAGVLCLKCSRWNGWTVVADLLPLRRNGWNVVAGLAWPELCGWSAVAGVMWLKRYG